MRIAVLADIHGNPIALDAALADVEVRGGADAYWLLGDHAALGHDPVGSLDRITALPNATFIRGNTDRYTTARDRPGPTVDEVRTDGELFERWREVESSFSWTLGAITQGGYLGWLSALPLDVRFTTNDGVRILGVHASPGLDDGHGVHPGRSDEQLRDAFRGCEADVVFVGHTHVVVDRVVDGTRIINPGSVSNHLGSDVTAKYAILTCGHGGCEVELRRVPYDTDAVLDALARVRHPAQGYISRFFRGEMDPPW